MRGTIIRIWPVMQCPECEGLKPGGDRRPGVDDLREEFFWKCDCGWRGLSKAVSWQAELKDMVDDAITQIQLYNLERTVMLSAGDRIVKRYLINDSKDAFGEGFTSSWEVEEY